MRLREIADGLGHGTRAALVNNLSAFGFSVMITATFGLLSAQLGSPGAPDVFLFAAGGVAGVTLIDGVTSKGFRRRLRGETSDVLALGTGFSFISVLGAIGSADLLAEILGDGGSAWPLGAFAACCVFVLLSGVEMSVAKVLQEDRDAEAEEEP